MVLAGRQKLTRSIGREIEAFTRRRLDQVRPIPNEGVRVDRNQISFPGLFTRNLLVLVYWRCVDPRGCKTGNIRFLILLLVKNKLNHGCSPQFACIFMCSYYYSAQDLADKTSTYLINQSALIG